MFARRPQIPQLCAAIVALIGAVVQAQPVGQGFGGGVVRYFENEEATRIAPSFVLERPPRAIMAVPDGYPLAPVFSEAAGKRVVTIKTPAGVSFYGLGREPGPMFRDGFSSEGRAVACPWVLGVRPDGTAFGVLADTTWPCSVDLRDGVVFATEAPTLPVICFDGAAPDQVIVNLSQVTGIMEMPPRWALGPQVISGNADPIDWATWLRESHIAADTIWLQTAPTDDELDAPGLSDRTGAAVKVLNERRFRVVLPLVGLFPAAEHSAAYAAGTSASHWVQIEDGTPQDHPLPRGSAGGVSPDFTRAPTRDWWAGLVRQAAKDGIHGFAGPFNTTPLDNRTVLRADAALGGPAPAPRYQAVLDTLHTRATWAGAGGQQDNRRPFVVSEAAGSLTSQRSSAALIRDARHPIDLHDLVRRALSSGLSGMPLVGVSARPSPDEADTVRRIALASMLPLAVLDHPDGPRAISPAAAEAARRAFERRSRLIPHLYTLCFFNFRFGDPILRPMFVADPNDPALRSSDDMFLLGKDLLVVPRLSSEPKPAPPLKGRWRKIDLGDGDHPDLPDLYLRPGAILPLGPVMQRTDERPLDPLTLLVNLDDQGQASGELYGDDGDGYAFYEGHCHRIGYTADLRDGSVYIRLGALDGGTPLPRRVMEVRILTDAGETTGTGSERGTLKIDLPVRKDR